MESAPERNKPPSTCFNCTRLNGTTFLIVEDDMWYEIPFIYVKIYDNTLVLIDTGCGGAAKDKSVELKSLRNFLETYPVSDNEGSPLNAGGAKDYVIICTHCHFDHIGRFLDPGMLRG
jgi:glyoxylase-like metal-dependent hydrolase (beta-lactamase superfamily II)